MSIPAWNTVPFPRRRLLVAIGASVLVHALIADGWRPSGGARQDAAVLTQLQARLEAPTEPQLVTAAEGPQMPPGLAPAKPTAQAPVPAQRERTRASAASGNPSAAGAGAAAPDPRFYAARELDRYPLPLTPLDLRTAMSGAGSVRLWLSIDLAGNVVDVVVIDADPSAAVASIAREHVLTTRFLPAVKDGRAVKSRILLELRYGN